MSKTRIKPDAVIIGTLDQAKGALAELAMLDRSLSAIEADMNETIDQVKANADGEAGPLRERSAALAGALQGWATVNKDQLFAGRKSLELPHGTIGFRKSTSIVARAKVRMSQVLEKLKELGFDAAVKRTETVNKETLRDWPEERLAAVGMRRKVADVFFVELAREEIKEQAV